MTFRGFAVVLVGLVGSVANSADDTGNFMLGGGAGAMPCPEYVATMEKARTLGIGTVQYAEHTSSFVMYILGFQSGYNMAANDTYDVFPGTNGDYAMLAWIESYCRSHSSSRFGDGLVALARDSNVHRQKKITQNESR